MHHKWWWHVDIHQWIVNLIENLLSSPLHIFSGYENFRTYFLNHMEILRLNSQRKRCWEVPFPAIWVAFVTHFSLSVSESIYNWHCTFHHQYSPWRGGGSQVVHSSYLTDWVSCNLIGLWDGLFLQWSANEKKTVRIAAHFYMSISWRQFKWEKL